MIQAVFFDIDGTLLNHEDGGAMPSSTLESLWAMRRRGIGVYVATGRAPFMLGALREMFPFDGFVTLNGQYIVDSAFRVLATGAHDPEDIRRLIPLVRREHIACMIIEGMESFPVEDDAFMRMMYGYVGMELPPLYDLRRLETHPVLQFTAYLMRDGVEWPDFVPLEEGVRALAGLPGVEVTSAGGGILDCIPRQGGKEVGIAKLAALRGLRREEIMVFGDGPNDARMLRWAGTGVAMGNGDPAAKAAADYVTDPVGRDGVKHALLHFGVLQEDAFNREGRSC